MALDYSTDIKAKRDEDLLVLPSDAALFEDPSFKVYAEIYAEDQEIFFEDYAEAHAKLNNLGAKFDPPKDIKAKRDEDLLVLPTDAALFEDPSSKVNKGSYVKVIALFI
ncbi:heme peroxidase [Corchorus capsularis]|uniref:Heme peroxidase n=1 Tax=Corchorus capsularis TaxID=210143 RepID=A0A1R3I0K9_COCAP|nr:heme peroxidase [Corchorus capsularis]